MSDRQPSDPQTLTGLFAASVAGFTDRPAVSDQERSLTYAELDQRSSALAAHLRSRGLVAEDRVGVYLRRSVDLFVAILGVLKAGAAYVTIDTRYPDTRRDLMITQSGAKVVVTEPGWDERLEHLGVKAVTCPDLPSEGAESHAFDLPSPHSAASVLFTSGSSGEPKAIVLEHRNLVFFACNESLPQLRPEDRTGQISNVSFDAFSFEMWSTLAHGAEVVVLPPVPELLAADFQREMRRRRITAMLVPTMVLNHVVREDRDAFASLRVLQVGGDVVRPSACRELLAGQFRGELYNLYGPAEITTACTVQRITEAEAALDSVPIGRPLAGASVRLMTDDLRPVARGEVGEIHVGGPGVARGYLDAPDLTDERFLADPSGTGARWYRTGDLAREREDGSLEFVGRADGQVKIRGYRVEPGEVERGLRRHPEVHEAAVLPSGEGNDRHLAAFVVLDGDLPLADLRAFASAELPDFMVPSHFITLPEIPANDHGKRDLGALHALLKEYRNRQASRVDPVTETERYLADLWSALLGVDAVGANEDFFDLGGHSLLAFRMQSRIKRERGVALSYQAILQNPTLAGLAAAVDDVAQSGDVA
ncbi:amino acid adenylation domain-containing protein [Micromonospora sediminicola]|uniref:amino acid adenylation domain-containing protein n=1 Tax=Micromonospora sediminicola TaxID=946078 RepID=UPI00378FCCB7